jgi:hypothetical protein
MRINPRKIWKILGRFGQLLIAFLKPFALKNYWMHRHECNTYIFLFNLENQTKDFSYTIFPIKKINVGKILKL